MSGGEYFLKGQHDRAITDYTEAIRLDPNDPVAFAARGSVYADKGQHDRANRRLHRSDEAQSEKCVVYLRTWHGVR